MTSDYRIDIAMAAAFKYEKVANHLRQLLASSTLGSDRRLPSFSTLRRQLKVTQATIDSALAVLEGEGLIDRRPGAGIFASAPATGSNGIARNGILILSGFPLDLPSAYHHGGWGSAVFFGALAYCHRKAYRITLMDPHRLGAQEVRSMEGAKPGAILLMPSEDLPLSTYVHQLCASPVPLKIIRGTILQRARPTGVESRPNESEFTPPPECAAHRPDELRCVRLSVCRDLLR